jgi:hypothetical protein
MASKTIIICDLCGQESSKEDLSIISVKRPNKPVNKHEICASCLEKFLTQIASTKILDNDWAFSNSEVHTHTKKENPVVEEYTEEDDIFNRHQARELKLSEAKIDGEWKQSRNVTNGPETVLSSNEECPHYNKGPVMKGSVDGRIMFFHRCRDCGKALKPRSKK